MTLTRVPLALLKPSATARALSSFRLACNSRAHALAQSLNLQKKASQQNFHAGCTHTDLSKRPSAASRNLHPRHSLHRLPSIFRSFLHEGNLGNLMMSATFSLPRVSRLSTASPFDTLPLPSTPAPSASGQFSGNLDLKLPPPGHRYIQNDDVIASQQLEEVEWDPALANSITLIGKVAWVKYIQHKSSFFFGLSVPRRSKKGKAQEELTQAGEGHTSEDWYTVKVFGTLAHSLAREVSDSTQLHVAGQVEVETYTSTFEDTTATKHKTTVVIYPTMVRRVRTSSKAGLPWGPAPMTRGTLSQGELGSRKFVLEEQAVMEGQQTQWTRTQQLQQKSGDGDRSKEKLWKQYFEDPSQFFDNRTKKISPRSPDFRHKVTGEVLWIDGWYTPAYVKERLGRTED